MKQHTIITIGRQFGAGGREIGKQLSQQLSIPYYDKQLLALAAKQMGYNQQIFIQNDEQHTLRQTILQWLGNLPYPIINQNMMTNDTLFQTQSEIIRRLAQKQNCIIIGRCSDYILRDNPNTINIFLSANLDDRIQRVSQRMNITPQQAQQLIQTQDRKRAQYYNYYSSKTWGAAATYHLCLNVSLLGIQGTVDTICQIIQKKP